MASARSTFRHTIASIAVIGLFAPNAAPPTCALAGAVETVKPVSFADVHVDGGLWAKRLDISRSVTIPEAEQVAQEALSLETARDVNNYLREQTRRILPEVFN